MRGLYSLGGGNPNGCCAGSEFGRAGSVGQDTRGHCAVCTLLYYSIVLLYDCTIVIALLHTCTIGLYCSLLQAMHFIVQSYYCPLLQFIDFIVLQCTIPQLHFCTVVHTARGSYYWIPCTIAGWYRVGLRGSGCWGKF